MLTISHNTVRGRAYMTGLEAFDSPVDLTGVQLRELISRVLVLKHPSSASPVPAVKDEQEAHAGRELVALRHPVHVIADLVTMSERAALPVNEIAFCCTGDASSPLAQSLLFAGTALGMDVRIAAPAKFWPDDATVATAHHLAASNRAGLLITTNNARAAEGAHFFITVPFGRHVSTTITETSALVSRPPATHPLSEEQDANRLWVLEAVLADWLSEAGSTWSRSAGS